MIQVARIKLPVPTSEHRAVISFDDIFHKIKSLLEDCLLTQLT